MVSQIRPAQDPFGLGRLADSLRQNRAEKRQQTIDAQNAITQGLQQQLLGGKVQAQQGQLSDLAAQRQQRSDLGAAVGQDTGESNTLKTINFFKKRDPARARSLIEQTFEAAGNISKFNSQGAVDFINSELGFDWKLDADDKETITIDQGNKKVLINKSDGSVIQEFPVIEPESEEKPTTLIKNLEAAGLKQGTPAFQQAVLANIQKTGRTQTIEVGPDGGIKIIERAGPQEQKAELAQAEAEKADKKRTENAIGQANTVINKVDQVLENVGLGTAGAGSLFSIVPGTPAKDLAANIETLKANLAFNALQAMREASKTGGALGAVSERELSLLESQIASLDPKQSPEQLRENLGEVRLSFENMLNKAKQPEAPKPTETIKVFNFDAQGNLIQ